MAMGRPRKDFGDKEWDKVNIACQFKMPAKDVAGILECSVDTLENRIREKYDCTFSEFREQKMATTNLNLFSKQVSVALEGNVTMLIWLGKNYLNQTDKQETTLVGTENPIQIHYEKKSDENN